MTGHSPAISCRTELPTLSACDFPFFHCDVLVRFAIERIFLLSYPIDFLLNKRQGGAFDRPNEQIVAMPALRVIRHTGTVEYDSPSPLAVETRAK
jgi:hypothetical protein